MNSYSELKNDNTSLDDKNELILEYLRNEVFGDLIPSQYSQQPYDENSIIFDEPILEEFALKAKEYLEKLGYEVEIFEDLTRSNRYETYCAFVYANNKENLQEAINYMLEKDCYSLLENENNKDLEQKTQTKIKQFKRK